MALSKSRGAMYEQTGEDIDCYECNETLEPEEAYTCKDCSTDFCKNHIHNHKC